VAANLAGWYAESTPKVRRKYAVRGLPATGSKAALPPFGRQALGRLALQVLSSEACFQAKPANKPESIATHSADTSSNESDRPTSVSAMMLASAPAKMAKTQSVDICKRPQATSAASEAGRITMARIMAGPIGRITCGDIQHPSTYSERGSLGTSCDRLQAQVFSQKLLVDLAASRIHLGPLGTVDIGCTFEVGAIGGYWLEFLCAASRTDQAETAAPTACVDRC